MSKLLTFSSLHLHSCASKDFFLKDPILGFINFSKNQFWLYELVNTFEFQRLNKLKQLAVSFNHFPSAVNSRLSHSLGVYEICNRFTKHFLSGGYLDEVHDSKAISIALASALLHDIGHGPLSHVFEGIMKNSFKHEEMTKTIISSKDTKINYLLRSKAISDGLPEEYYIEEILNVFNKQSKYKWIMDLISSDIDVDRLDFLARDSFFSGVSYGNTIDVSLFIKWSVIKNGKLYFQVKSKNMLEQFKLSRENLHKDLYWNKVAEVYQDLLVRGIDIVRNNQDKYKYDSEFKKISFLFSPQNTWNLFDFLSLYDDNFLDIVKHLFSFDIEGLSDIYACLFGFGNNKEISEYIKKFPDYNSTRKKLTTFTIDLWDMETDSCVKFKIK